MPRSSAPQLFMRSAGHATCLLCARSQWPYRRLHGLEPPAAQFGVTLLVRWLHHRPLPQCAQRRTARRRRAAKRRSCLGGLCLRLPVASESGLGASSPVLLLLAASVLPQPRCTYGMRQLLWWHTRSRCWQGWALAPGAWHCHRHALDALCLGSTTHPAAARRPPGPAGRTTTSRTRSRCARTWSGWR